MEMDSKAIAIGQYDDPYEQKQPILCVNPYLDNIAVFGGPMSGKTTLIKTFLLGMYKRSSQKPLNFVYVIDFGNNIGDYSKLPNVCACFDGANEENIKRVFRVIDTLVDKNVRMLDGQSYNECLKSNPDDAPVHITLIIENLNVFWEDDKYSIYHDILVRFCRDGLSKGLSVVVTLNDPTGLSRLLSNFRQKIAFEMPGDKYFEIFGTKVNKPISIPGRGIINRKEHIYEFQCFLPFENTAEERKTLSAMDKIKKIYSKEYSLKAFPRSLNSSNYIEYMNGEDTETSGGVIVGLDYYSHDPLFLDPYDHSVISIYGNKTFNRIKFLERVVVEMTKAYPDSKVVFLDDGRKELFEIYNNVQYENSDKNLYCKSLDEVKDYINSKGFNPVDQRTDVPGSKYDIPKQDDRKPAMTIFVVQYMRLYSGADPLSKNFIERMIPACITGTDQEKCCFIFSDVKKFSDTFVPNTVFNGYVSSAILLDDIVEHITNKSHSSVFSDMNSIELKKLYARCSDGDAYYYITEKDDLRKMKLIE